MSQADLSGALAWLDYCLEETAAAMEAVRTGGAVGGVPAGQYHEICEAAAGMITLRGRTRRWAQGVPGWRFSCFGEARADDHE
jgi:hypothetical protein